MLLSNNGVDVDQLRRSRYAKQNQSDSKQIEKIERKEEICWEDFTLAELK